MGSNYQVTSAFASPPSPPPAPRLCRRGRRGSQQPPKVIRRQSGGFGDAAHGDGVDWIVARNHRAGFAVAHDDVSAFAGDVIAELLKHPHGVALAEAGKFGISNGHFGERAGFAPGFGASVFLGDFEP